MYNMHRFTYVGKCLKISVGYDVFINVIDFSLLWFEVGAAQRKSMSNLEYFISK